MRVGGGGQLLCKARNELAEPGGLLDTDLMHKAFAVGPGGLRESVGGRLVRVGWGWWGIFVWVG